MLHKRLFYCLFALLICSTVHVRAQTVGKDEGYENEPIKEEEVQKNTPFPFVPNTMEAHYNLYLDLTDSSITHQYRSVFRSHRLAFTGDTWDEVLRQMVEQHNPKLARVLNTIPADDGLQISTGNDKSGQETFLKTVQPFLNDIPKLEDFLSHHLDRNRLPE
ncbi:hypothetical protein ACTHGU_21550 [Chitinophagaceae bacterium MMS25-I14]